MFNPTIPDIGAGVFLLIFWEIFWKGVGLWKSAKRNDLVWFIAILLINFLGLISIFYLWRTKQLEVVLKEFQTFFKSKFKKH